MRMTHLFFKYKQWYWFPIAFVNFFIPISMIFFKIVIGSWGANLSLLLSLVLLFLPMMCVYIHNTLKENRAALHLIVNPKENFSRFTIGIVSAFLLWNISLASAVPCLWQDMIDNMGVKIYSYVATVCVVILGIISNVFLNMFEFKFNFDIFYSKYKDSMIKDVLAVRDERRSLKSSS